MPRFFKLPWATTGDKVSIPMDTIPGGEVSYAQGFGPRYEIAPGDPNWLPVPRDETNGLYFDITDNLRQYQINGVPDWHPPADNDGVAISYPDQAVVRWNDLVWRSISATNTAEPGTDITKWVIDAVFNLPLLEATLAEMLAASLGTKIATPRRVGAAVQSGAYTYATAGGTANVVTAAFTPAITAYTSGLELRVKLANTNTGAATFNANGVGAVPIKTLAGADVIAGDLVAGAVMTFVYDNATGSFVVTNLSSGVGALGIGAVQTFTANGTWTRPSGCRAIQVEVQGGGGAGGGASNPGSGNIRVGGGGGGGGYSRRLILSPPASQAVVVGAGGSGGTGGGGSGGLSSFGTVQATGGGGASLEPPTTVANASGAPSGGIGSGGDINISGSTGGRGIALVNNNWGGAGGQSFYGGGGFGSGVNLATGGAGTGYGGGGGGAVAVNTTGNASGGSGTPGVVIITEYY